MASRSSLSWPVATTGRGWKDRYKSTMWIFGAVVGLLVVFSLSVALVVTQLFSVVHDLQTQQIRIMGDEAAAFHQDAKQSALSDEDLLSKDQTSRHSVFKEAATLLTGTSKPVQLFPITSSIHRGSGSEESNDRSDSSSASKTDESKKGEKQKLRKSSESSKSSDSSMVDGEQLLNKNSKKPESKPKTPKTSAFDDEDRPDCWRDDMHARAAAPPCKTPGAPDVEGSAKVALLFMTNNRIPTEPVWTAFIASAAELTLRKRIPPTQPSPPHLLPPIARKKEEMDATCWEHGGDLMPFGVHPRESFKGYVPPMIGNVTGWMKDQCAVRMTPKELYEAQDLFSIYVHRAPNAEASSETSIFAGRDVPNRVEAAYAQPSLVKAFQILLKEALKDPRNTKFISVSETCIPLHHPALFWAQSMAEAHVSRVNSGRYNLERWNDIMETQFLKAEHFQKGDQWMALTRMHAELVANDDHVWAQFEMYCRTQMSCGQPDRFWGHVCVADEHFVPTLLAAYKLDKQRDGVGVVTFTDWTYSPGSWHPRTFMPGDTRADILSMRSRTRAASCPKVPYSALKSAATIFEHRDVCEVGDNALPSYGPHFVTSKKQIAWRRKLQVHGHDDELPPEEMMQQRSMNGFQASRKLTDDNERIGGDAMLEHIVDERGTERERIHLRTGVDIRSAMVDNLEQNPWLEGFKPMPMHCPLLGRRVAWQAVADYATLAWSCDGLGFAWECIQAAGDHKE